MKKFNDLISELFLIDFDKINDSLSINNTESWDSLKHMELIIAIEENYNIKLTTDEIVSMINIKKIKNILKKRGVNV